MKKDAKSFFDKFSEEYEQQSRYKYLFYKWIIKNVFSEINKPASKIIDMGTGNGELGIRLALKFPNASVIGVDISRGMIKQAQKKVRRIKLRNIAFLVSPIEKIKIKKSDFVVSSVAFHHVKDKKEVLAKLNSILPRGGKVIIGDYFVPSAAYKKEVQVLRKKNPTLANKFDKSWKQFLKDMSKDYSGKHPIEYNICPIKLKEIMIEAGFKNVKIKKCLLPNFSMVVGKKVS